MAITVAEARAELLLLKKDLSDVSTDTFQSWCNDANRFVYQYICGIDPERFTSTQSYSVNSAPQTSALPTDFENIQGFNMGFYYVQNNGQLSNWPLVQSGPGAISQGYYIVGDNVIFTGIGSPATYTLRYIPKPITLTTQTGAGSYFTQDGTSTGKVIVLNEYIDLLVKYLDVLYCQWDEDPNAESLADFRLSRALGNMGKNIKKAPAVYVMPDDYWNNGPANGGLWYTTS